MSNSQMGLLTGNITIRPAEAEEEERNQEHIKTDHLLPDLKRRTISGGVVTVSAQAAKFALNLVSTVILARLLTPRDFGLVAMVTAVTGFLAMFRHAGLATPTVQREHLTHAQVSNLFWINLGVSGLCAFILAALSPIIARFYHDSRITPIMLLLSTTFLIGGFRVQHLALLKRQMRFKAIAIIEVGFDGNWRSCGCYHGTLALPVLVFSRFEPCDGDRGISTNRSSISVATAVA